MQKDSKLLIQAAKVRSSQFHPYLSSAVFSMRMIPTTECPTMGVDAKWNCYYNPETIDQWSVEVIATVIEHEVWHLLRNHHARRPAFGPSGIKLTNKVAKRIWNQATDCEINDDLARAAHYKLPECAIFPSSFNLEENKLAEWYYNNIPIQNALASSGEEEDEENEDDGDGVEGQGEGKGKPDENNETKSGDGGGASGEDKQKEKKEGAGSGESKDKKGKPQQFGGSSADGQPRRWETAEEHITPVEKELIKKRVARDIKRNNSRGDVPVGQARWADETLRVSVVPWNKELNSILKGHMAGLSENTDITYARQSRRQEVYGDVIMPGNFSFVPKIVIVVDTSASVSDDMLSQALTEIHHVLRASDGMNVTVMSCDAAVSNVQKVFTRKQVQFAGNGGTDMTVGITAALKLKAHLVVLITDGFTPYPKECPDTKVRWVTVVLNKDGAKPGYGKVVVTDI